MNFSTLLCVLFRQLKNEKSPQAAFYLLRGKRSGQMMQDVVYYNVHPFFGILPRLSQEVFNRAIDELVMERYIVIDSMSILKLTKKGEKLVKYARNFYFDGWNYRGKEEVFFARLSLIVQTLSYFKEGKKEFMPIQRNPDVQQFVRSFLRNYPINNPAFSIQMKCEIQHALEDSKINDEQKIVLTHRLVGHGYTGWTWGQLGEQLAMDSLNLKLAYIESLHMLLNTIIGTENYPLLSKIASDIKVEDHLNYSTRQTKSLFDRGYSLEDIASIRQLKLSTIEDHIVEMALDNEEFPFERFIEQKVCVAVKKKANELETKRLRILKESFPELSYFQLRLILSMSKEVSTK